MSTAASPDPHGGQAVLASGAPLGEARAAVVMLHGRGAAAEDIVALQRAIDPGGVAYVAPRAADQTWYPYSFLAPRAANEPWLSSALGLVRRTLAAVAEAGVATERTVLLGFSQGACLALEFALRHPARYGGVVGLSGGLIGPPGTAWDLRGSLGGAAVFLGCSDVDPHIPLRRVHETEAVLTALQAAVTTRIYPGLGHAVNDDELDHVRNLLASVAAAAGGPGGGAA